MKYTITEIVPRENDGLREVVVIVSLDDDLRALLGTIDPIAMFGRVEFTFSAHLSEAAMLSAIRNEIHSRKNKAMQMGKFAHLIGKVFEA